MVKIKKKQNLSFLPTEDTAPYKVTKLGKETGLRGTSQPVIHEILIT